MRAVHVLLGATASVAVLALLVQGLGPASGAATVGGALLAASAGLLAGAAVLGRLRADALALGALASLAIAGGLGPSAAIGGGLGLMLLHGARARRARHPAGAVLIAALAFAGGTLVVALLQRYAGLGVEREVSAFVVAAALGAIPFAVPTDDEMAFALRGELAAARGARRRRILRALVIRRRPLHRSRELEAAWRGLPAILSRASDAVAGHRLRALARAERAAHALERAELAIGSDEAPFDAERQLAAELEAIRELAEPPTG